MMITLDPVSASSADTLRAITGAFFAALDRSGGPVFAVASTVVAVGLGVAFVAWLRRDVRRERAAQTALDARHEAATQAVRGDERRRSARVSAHVPMTVRHTDGRHRVAHEPCHTLNISADAVAYLSYSPPTIGVPLDFTIDLGEERAVSLRGVVHRVETPCTPRAPALVVLMLGPLSTGEREHLARWVAHEQERRLAERSRGRLCSSCGRPVTGDGELVHPACADARAEQPPAVILPHRGHPRAHRRVLQDTSLRSAPVSVRHPR